MGGKIAIPGCVGAIANSSAKGTRNVAYYMDTGLGPVRATCKKTSNDGIAGNGSLNGFIINPKQSTITQLKQQSFPKT